MDFGVKIATEFFLPVWEPVRSYSELSRFVDFVVDLFEALLHCLKEHGGRTAILLAEEDTPSEERRLLKHLGLDLAVEVRARL